MNRIICIICSLLFGFVACKSMVIIPDFKEGQVWEYRIQSGIFLVNDADTVELFTSYIQNIEVVSVDAAGITLRASNKIEYIDCDKGIEQAGLFSDADFSEEISLLVRLSPQGAPTEVLNLEEIKTIYRKRLLRPDILKVEDEDGIRYEEVALDNDLVEGMISQLCTSEHLLQQEFGKSNMFDFYCIPFEEGYKMPSSLVLGQRVAAFLGGMLPQLDMMATGYENTQIVSVFGDEQQPKCRAQIYGQWEFDNGILKNGERMAVIKSGSVEITMSDFTTLL